MNKKVEPKTLSGFMELNPEDQILFNSLKRIIEDSYKKYGFWPLDTPTMEYSEVLLAKAGGETEKQIYRFKRGENDIALRFDLTVPLAKYVAQKYNQLCFPFKRYQIGKVFRGERPQKGRFREFYQCDIDVIGDGELSLMYDVEIPAIIYDIFSNMNFGKFIIRINNRKILNGFFEFLKLGDEATNILRIIDKFEKVTKKEIISMLREYNISESNIEKIFDFININGKNKDIIAKLRELNIDNELFIKGVNELETVICSLTDFNVPEEYFKIDLTIARGLDYYTGTVYETKLVDYPNLGSVCSGGRFENLADYYTDKKLPGVGISIGLTRLFYQLKENQLINDDKIGSANIVLLPMVEKYKYLNEIASELRRSGKSVNVCYANKKIKSKMKYANGCHAKYCIIIGEDELNNEKITIKNMVTGKQNTITRENLLDFFK